MAEGTLDAASRENSRASNAHGALRVAVDAAPKAVDDGAIGPRYNGRVAWLPLSRGVVQSE